MMAFAPGCFLWPSFCRSFPWSQLCRIFENARWGSPWQIWHRSASRALWDPRFAAECCARGLQQNVVLRWHLKEIVLRTWWHSRQGVFCGLLFARVSPGRNFAEFQKTRAEGLLGKFNIAQLHGHFGSSGLQQNVVLGWHFKEILIRTWWHSRQGVFLWPSFCRSFPRSQLCRISENARWESPWQIWHSSASRALWELRFAAQCCARLGLQGNAS